MKGHHNVNKGEQPAGDRGSVVVTALTAGEPVILMAEDFIAVYAVSTESSIKLKFKRLRYIHTNPLIW